MAVKSIDKVDSDLKVSLYNNIMLAGGTTMMNGFYERFCMELKHKVGDAAKTEI